MTDIILKIYSTTTNWADTLDHTLSGDVVDYRIIDNSNYLIDTAWFKIDDSNKRWSDQILPDHWDGSAENTQVWRAFSRANELINSGVITKVYKAGQHIIIEGEGMSALLKRRIIREKFFHTKDGSATATEGEFILADSTYGLVTSTDGLGTTYGSITLNTETPVSTEARVWKFDGVSLWDACVEVAKGSYGSNGYGFDVYLYETFTAPSTFTMNFYFKEIGSSASSKTITESDIHIPSFNLAEIARRNINQVIVRGEINPNATYPLDIHDFRDDFAIGLTASTHDGPSNVTTYMRNSASGDFINDGVVAGMYVSNLTDGSWGKVTSVTSTQVNFSGGLSDGADQDVDFGDTFQIGYAYSGNEDASGYISIASVNQGVYGDGISMYRDDATERQMYVFSKWGDNIDHKFHRLRFWAIASHFDDTAAELMFYPHLGVEDRYGNTNKDGNELGETSGLNEAPNFRCKIQAIPSGGSLTDAEFTFFDIPLPKPNNANGWEDTKGATSDDFINSDIDLMEWHGIKQVGFLLDDDSEEDIQYLVIDGLHFVGNVPYTGKYPTTAETYSREMVYHDNGLKSDTDCQNMAQNIRNGINQKDYEGRMRLYGINRDFSLIAGNTVEIVVQGKFINIQAGQTPATLPIQRITYTPNNQILEVGRHYSVDEIINQISMKTRLAKKTF